MGIKTMSCAAALAAGCAWPALGADMLFPPGVAHGGGRPGIVELGTGWYLRGDGAYVEPVKADKGDPIIDSGFSKSKLDATWSAGGGFGYKFVNWLRADITADHRFYADFEGARTLPGGIGSRLDRGRLESSTALVNAYLDLGNWSGITPYVGAGVGAAMNRVSDQTAQTTCLTLACGAIGTHLAIKVPERRTYDLAWALMGGVAVEMGAGFTVDLGYRYVNLGEARAHHVGAPSTTRGADIEAHEVRLGLRYMIDQ